MSDDDYDDEAIAVEVKTLRRVAAELLAQADELEGAERDAAENVTSRHLDVR